MIFQPTRAGSCPQCRGSLIRTKDDLDRWWLRCTCCGAQFPEDWGENASPTPQGSLLFKKPLRGLESDPGAS